MKILMKTFALAAALLLLCVGAGAQNNKFTVDAEFLNRGEIRNGGISGNSEDDSDANEGEKAHTDDLDRANFLLERTRLIMNYQENNMTAHLTGQHSGTWGGANSGAFSIYEAWVQFRSNAGFFAKVGRQNLSYDDQRIFGSDDWSMTGLSHDVLKFGYEGHGHKLHLIGAYNQNPENISGGTEFTGGLQPYKQMQAAWYHYDIPKTDFGASFLFMNVSTPSKLDAPSVFWQQIFGTYLSFSPKTLTAEAAYYHQGGKEDYGIPIDAWMASGKVSVKAVPGFVFYAGYDYLSGDENYWVPAGGMIGMPKLDVIRGFNSIYGSHHNFYGAMDFFYLTTYYCFYTPGLQNAYLGTQWAPEKKLNFDLSYHFLATAIPMEEHKQALGSEVELAVSYAFRKDATLSLGYSFMKGTDTMTYLKRTNDRGQLQWGWLMLVVKPSFFSSGK